jgi:glycosyltransferase involved in cell wall biosynthesis
LILSLSICHVVASINEQTGGPARSVGGIASALAVQGVDTHLLTLDYQRLGRQIKLDGVTLHSHQASVVTRLGRGIQPAANRELNKLAASGLHIIHNHGLWMRPNAYARSAAKRNRIPLVTSPRGMLEPWSIRNSRVKKKLAWVLFERENLNQVDVFHATSISEADSIRQLGFDQPIAVIQNGVDLPKLNYAPSRALMTERFPSLENRNWLLAMSRIHPVKGFDRLLQIWRRLSKQFCDWHLIIAGADLVGYQAELDRITRDLEVRDSVTFTGPLSGARKESALANADLFVLPSHSENFGIVVAESLAHGVPVVTTKATPWEELNTHNCGWWVDNDLQAIEAVTVRAMSLTSSERKRMGAQGRLLIEKKYSWTDAAQQMKAVYEWILGGGTPPDCVLT